MALGDIENIRKEWANLGSKKENLQAVKISEENKLKIIKNARAKFREDEEKAQIASDKKIAQLEQKLNKETFADKKRRIKEEYDLSVSLSQKLNATLKGLGVGLAEASSQSIKNTISTINSGINEYLGVYSQYMSGIETRLQGSAKTFSSITGTISSAVGSSQYVSQRKVLENLSKYVEQGIAYNVEQRAFLATVSDRIATTFNAFDSNLARIIRIQQADSTAARLGLESQLTKFFNNTFGDTSYLSQMFDVVSASLLGASATLGREKSVAFEYTVQKWLGSLTGVGVSESTIQQLAQGIGYLGTGDITSLSQNQALQNLLVMASTRAGLDYGSLLTGGITQESTNALLRSVVELSQEIANTNNRVVLSQYAKIFGMDITDLIAISNLTAKDLLQISSNMLQYEQLYSETENQIKSLGSRMTIKDRIDTMFDNIMSSVGENIANSAVSYTTWLLADLVEKSTGGIALPTVGVLGSFVDLNTTVTGLIKTGIVGVNVISEIGNILAGLTGANRLSLEKWGAEDIRSRGSGYTGLVTTGVSRTTSESRFIGNVDESAIYEGSVASATEEAKRSYQGEENDLADIIENKIAVDLARVVNLLDVEGIVIRGAHSAMFSGAIPEQGFGG